MSELDQKIEMNIFYEMQINYKNKTFIYDKE